MPETVTIQEVYRELLKIKNQMVSKEELQQLFETSEVLKNLKTMTQVHESDKDINSGRTKKVRIVKDLLEEMQ